MTPTAHPACTTPNQQRRERPRDCCGVRAVANSPSRERTARSGARTRLHRDGIRTRLRTENTERVARTPETYVRSLTLDEDVEGGWPNQDNQPAHRSRPKAAKTIPATAMSLPSWRGSTG